MKSFERILVATDLGEASKPALQMAVELALQFDAELTLVHICEFPAYQYTGGVPFPNDLMQRISDAAESAMAVTLDSLRPRCTKLKSVVKVGIPWREIMDVAEETQATLLVVGTHGRQGLQRAFLGSVAEKLVRMSPIPVLTVRGSDK